MKTMHRPVPLEHHLFILDKFHMIKEKDGDFLTHEFEGLKKNIDALTKDDLELKEKLKKKLDEKKEKEIYVNTNKSMA